MQLAELLIQLTAHLQLLCILDHKTIAVDSLPVQLMMFSCSTENYHLQRFLTYTMHQTQLLMVWFQNTPLTMAAQWMM